MFIYIYIHTYLMPTDIQICILYTYISIYVLKNGDNFQPTLWVENKFLWPRREVVSKIFHVLPDRLCFHVLSDLYYTMDTRTFRKPNGPDFVNTLSKTGLDARLVEDPFVVLYPLGCCFDILVDG